MRPVAISRTWRWFSIVFGVLLPLSIWGWISWVPSFGRERSSEFTWINDLFVLLECAAMAWFVVGALVGRRWSKPLRVWFGAGAVYALIWALLGVLILPSVLHGDGGPLLPSVVVVFIYLVVPWACVWIYFRNARLLGRLRGQGATK